MSADGGHDLEFLNMTTSIFTNWSKLASRRLPDADVASDFLTNVAPEIWQSFRGHERFCMHKSVAFAIKTHTIVIERCSKTLKRHNAQPILDDGKT